jgi:hypothetical protein
VPNQLTVAGQSASLLGLAALAHGSLLVVQVSADLLSRVKISDVSPGRALSSSWSVAVVTLPPNASDSEAE